MQWISVRMQLRIVNIKVTHHNNFFVGEAITVQATPFKYVKKSVCLGGR